MIDDERCNEREGRVDRPASPGDRVICVDEELRQATREVDRTLIRWALRLGPRERLRAASNAARALARFRRVAP